MVSSRGCCGGLPFAMLRCYNFPPDVVGRSASPTNLALARAPFTRVKGPKHKPPAPAPAPTRVSAQPCPALSDLRYSSLRCPRAALLPPLCDRGVFVKANGAAAIVFHSGAHCPHPRRSFQVKPTHWLILRHPNHPFWEPHFLSACAALSALREILCLVAATLCAKMPRQVAGVRGGLTLEKLASYDDVITDALVDKVSRSWTGARHASRGELKG